MLEGLKDTRRKAQGAKPREHIVVMPPLVHDVLKRHHETTTLNQPGDFVFSREDGRPLGPDHMRRYVLYPAFDAVAIPRTKWCSGVHMFRHTVITLIAKQHGLKVAQEQAGHADINTTANTYTHVSFDQKTLAAQSLNDSIADLATYLLPAS